MGVIRDISLLSFRTVGIQTVVFADPLTALLTVLGPFDMILKSTYRTGNHMYHLLLK